MEQDTWARMPDRRSRTYRGLGPPVLPHKQSGMASFDGVKNSWIMVVVVPETFRDAKTWSGKEGEKENCKWRGREEEREIGRDREEVQADRDKRPEKERWTNREREIERER